MAWAKLKARKDRKAKAWSRAWAIRTLGGGDFARYYIGRHVALLEQEGVSPDVFAGKLATAVEDHLAQQERDRVDDHIRGIGR